MMEFTHHSRLEDEWTFDPTRQYQQSVDPAMKPRGFWLGVDGDWKRWVDEEGMGWADSEPVRFDVDLDKMLVLATGSDLLAFDRENRSGREGWGFSIIDWSATISNYSGIVIAPHHYSLRFDTLWYSSWDCASACVWDLSAIQPTVQPAQIGAEA